MTLIDLESNMANIKGDAGVEVIPNAGVEVILNAGVYNIPKAGVDVISKAGVDVPKQSSGGQSTSIVLLYYLDNSIVYL